ncbi:MAG: hypothetical protein KA368_24130, partial [Acidobacteria bacterium]|nr:hypothetical protein [Acidobacteriota bacterium]
MKFLDSLKNRSFPPQTLAVAVALCSAAALLIFWRAVPSAAQANENSDYLKFYEPVAQNLASGKGLVTNAGLPAIHYPPAYPLLLAASFK